MPKVAANGMSERNFSEKLTEIENTLRDSGAQWLSGETSPGAADADAIEAVRGQLPDPRAQPHAYAWYAMVSKFRPEKLASMK